MALRRPLRDSAARSSSQSSPFIGKFANVDHDEVACAIVLVARCAP